MLELFRQPAGGPLAAPIEICVERHRSRWFTGPYGFVLARPRVFEKPIPMKGRLGFFEVEIPAASFPQWMIAQAQGWRSPDARGLGGEPNEATSPVQEKTARKRYPCDLRDTRKARKSVRASLPGESPARFVQYCCRTRARLACHSRNGTQVLFWTPWTCDFRAPCDFLSSRNPTCVPSEHGTKVSRPIEFLSDSRRARPAHLTGFGSVESSPGMDDARHAVMRSPGPVVDVHPSMDDGPRPGGRSLAPSASAYLAIETLGHGVAAKVTACYYFDIPYRP